MPSTNYYIDSDGELYREISSDLVLKLSDGKTLSKFTITTLEPVTGNPIGLLLALTYA